VFTNPYAKKHQLEDFSMDRTFEPNTGQVIQLTPMQIILLANFTSRMAVRRETVDLVKRTLTVPLS
jgi:hypothetical protein